MAVAQQRLEWEEAVTEADAVAQPPVAYIMSRFPKLTETFILYEILAVERAGTPVEIYPLMRERTTVMHPEAVALVERAHFQPFISWPILKSQFYYLTRRPGAYFKALFDLLRGTFGSLRYFIGALSFFPKSVHFARLMEASGIRHVHAHFASHPAAAAFVIHRLTGIPYSFTGHGSDLHRDRHMLKEKVAEAAFVVAISNFNRDLILSEAGEQYAGKVKVVHCGVDTHIFQPHRLERSADEAFKILCIGTLHEVKGQTFLIEACRRLAERGIRFSCHFIGDGPDQEALQAQVSAAGLEECVHFEGRRKREEVISWLQHADVLVAPSVPSRDGRREGLPVVLIEALGSGVPAIASRLSGIPELIEDGVTGYLIEPGNVDQLVDALERLVRDPELRRRLGRNGREKVVREFDLDQNAKTLIRYFQGAF
ncbi:MAG: glycosyltransferase [Chloroflexota bacterium]|nr:MAG: colanic acid biosynthesis glycosyltransferase WcaL [Chloroflexota bacterium]